MLTCQRQSRRGYGLAPEARRTAAIRPSGRGRVVRSSCSSSASSDLEVHLVAVLRLHFEVEVLALNLGSLAVIGAGCVLVLVGHR